jgi:hypothetical protein
MKDDLTRGWSKLHNSVQFFILTYADSTTARANYGVSIIKEYIHKDQETQHI